MAVAETGGAHRSEVRGRFILQHQRHAIDEQRLHHARHEPLGQPVQIEVAVQVAREADQCPAVVVAIAVEGAIERGLYEFLDGRRKQHRHQRGQERDHPFVRGATLQEHALHRLEQHRVDDHDRGKRRRVHERALDDHLHVHQPVTNDGRGVGKRDEAEWNRGELHGQRRLHADRIRQRVSEREWSGAERGPPGNPAQLAAGRNRGDLRQRAREPGQPADEAQPEVQELKPIEHREERRKPPGVAAARRHRDDAGNAERCGGNVRRDDERGARGAARPPPRPFRKIQREVQEQRRQQQDRHFVGPEEDPVEPVEAPAEREGEDAEEGSGKPEEVQGGGVARPPQAYGAADQQREHADRREHEIERARAAGQGCEPDVDDLPRPQAQDRVPERRVALRRVQRIDDVRNRLHRAIVDGQQDVAALQPDPGCRGPGRDLLGNNALGARGPEHAIVDFAPGRARRDVRRAETEERRHHEYRQRRP
jgi:hypothetical protein